MRVAGARRTRRAVGRACLVGLLVAGPAWPAAAATGASGSDSGSPVVAEPQTSTGVAETEPAVAAARRQPEDHLPVTVTVTQLEPREVQRDSTVRVVAVLQNTGTAPTGPLRYRLQRGALIETRRGLTAADADPPPITTQFAPFTELPAGLAPGQRLQVTYTCAVQDLRLIGLGVYPLGFVVQAVAADTGEVSTVGEARTWLPSFVGIVPRQTRVAWLWPLLDRPHRRLGTDPGSPLFSDDQLARSVSPGGRLDRLLTTAERVTGRVRLTLVVDPEMIESLRLMTDDYRVGLANKSVPGQGQQVAASWLTRLRRIAPAHLLVAVPYADPDVVALDRGRLAHLTQPSQADVDRLATELRAPVTTRLAWPPGGLLTDTALDEVVKQGASAVFLDPAALPGGASRAVPTASSVSPLPALGGQAAALVGDAGLQAVVARAAEIPGGPRLAEQRYLAELTMITAEDPAQARTLVVAPPRRWNPAPGYATAVLVDTARISWLTSLTTADVVRSTPPVDRGPLVYPAAAARGELPARTVRAIGEVQALVTDFRTVLTNEDANDLLAGYGAALRRAASSAWRDNPANGRVYVNRLKTQIELLRRQVGIVKPSTGVYTLASADSPLTLTVVNQLSRPVKVRLHFDTDGSIGFHADDVGVQEIAASSRSTVRVPAEVQRAGTFTVRVELTSPWGRRLGEPVTLTVRSTAYGTLALAITGLALLVLVAAVVGRLIRRVLGRGAGAPSEPAGSPAERSRA